MARHQTALPQLWGRALKLRDLQALFADSVILLRHTLAVDLVGVLELEPDGRQMVLRAGTGWREGSVGRAAVPVEPRT